MAYIYDICPCCGRLRFGHILGHYMLCKNRGCVMYCRPAPKALETVEQILTYTGWITDDGREWFNPETIRYYKMKGYNGSFGIWILSQDKRYNEAIGHA